MKLIYSRTGASFPDEHQFIHSSLAPYSQVNFYRVGEEVDIGGKRNRIVEFESFESFFILLLLKPWVISGVVIVIVVRREHGRNCVGLGSC